MEYIFFLNWVFFWDTVFCSCLPTCWLPIGRLSLLVLLLSCNRLPRFQLLKIDYYHSHHGSRVWVQHSLVLYSGSHKSNIKLSIKAAVSADSWCLPQSLSCCWQILFFWTRGISEPIGESLCCFESSLDFILKSLSRLGPHYTITGMILAFSLPQIKSTKSVLIIPKLASTPSTRTSFPNSGI